MAIVRSAGCAALVLCFACSGGDKENNRSEGAGTGADPAGAGGIGGAGSGSPGFNNSTDTSSMLPPYDADDPVNLLLNDPDGDACDTLSLDPETEVISEPGNLLVVFDRSSSMGAQWGNLPRWQSAANALRDALIPLSCDPSMVAPDTVPCVEVLSVAAIMFPTVGGLSLSLTDGPTTKGDTASGACSVDNLGSTEQIPWMGTWDFIQAWNGFWAAGAPTNRLEIGTPINMAFDVADTEITGNPREGTTAVVVLTDGDPICAQGQAADVTAGEWNANLGIQTYAVGLPGDLGGAALNAVAVAGGTGTPIAPTQPQTLTDAIRDIAFATVNRGYTSCTLNFDEDNLPQDPDAVQLFVTNDGDGMKYAVPRDRDGGDWTMSADGTSAELNGTLCEEATGGLLSNLTFVLTCPDGDAPPPLPVIIPE